MPPAIAATSGSGGSGFTTRGSRHQYKVASMPMYETALITNAATAPAAATITPPIAGPTLRARLKPTALTSTAGAI